MSDVGPSNHRTNVPETLVYLGPNSGPRPSTVETLKLFLCREEKRTRIRCLPLLSTETIVLLIHLRTFRDSGDRPCLVCQSLISKVLVQ